jgi:hypothetical protein
MQMLDERWCSCAEATSREGIESTLRIYVSGFGFWVEGLRREGIESTLLTYVGAQGLGFRGFGV